MMSYFLESFETMTDMTFWINNLKQIESPHTLELISHTNRSISKIETFWEYAHEYANFDLICWKEKKSRASSNRWR